MHPGPAHGAHDDASLAAAAPKVAALARDLEGQADALVISCTAGPGLEDVRAEGIPVMAAGSAAAPAALAIGGTLGMLGLKGSVPELLARILAPTRAVPAGPWEIAVPTGFHTPPPELSGRSRMPRGSGRWAGR